MSIREVSPIVDRAEGLCCGVPYDTQLVSRDGINMHFWLGQRRMTPELATHLKRAASWERDCVSFSWCRGEPLGFWARCDFGAPLAEG